MKEKKKNFKTTSETLVGTWADASPPILVGQYYNISREYKCKQ